MARMVILFLKATPPPADDDIEPDVEDEALKKIRAGFVDDVKKAKTKEEREYAEERLRKLDAGLA